MVLNTACYPRIVQWLVEVFLLTPFCTTRTAKAGEARSVVPVHLDRAWDVIGYDVLGFMDIPEVKSCMCAAID